MGSLSSLWVSMGSVGALWGPVGSLRPYGVAEPLCPIGYVGAATVGAAAWWFLYAEDGPNLTYHQLVSCGVTGSRGRGVTGSWGQG